MCAFYLYIFAPHPFHSLTYGNECLQSIVCFRPIVVWRLFWWRASPECFSVDLWITAKIEIKKKYATKHFHHPTTQPLVESGYWFDLRKPYFRRFDSYRRHATSKVDNNNSKENSTNFSTHTSHNPLSIWNRLCATWRIHTRNSLYAFWIGFSFFFFFSLGYLEVTERMVAMTISHFARKIKFAVHFLRSFAARYDFRLRRDAVAHQRMIFILLALTRT